MGIHANKSMTDYVFDWLIDPQFPHKTVECQNLQVRSLAFVFKIETNCKNDTIDRRVNIGLTIMIIYKRSRALKKTANSNSLVYIFVHST